MVTVGEDLLLAPAVDLFLDRLATRVLVVELCDGALALRTTVLFVADPLRDASKAVLVVTTVERCLFVEAMCLEAYDASEVLRLILTRLLLLF